MPVIQRLQNAVLEENGSTSSDETSPSVQGQKDGIRHAPIGPLPLQGKSRSWLSASRLQENLKKAVNTPFSRSKSMTVHAAKPDPPQKEMQYHDTTVNKDSASLSFTAITESLSASSEDLSSALGRKFEQLLHSALSSSEDSSAPPSSELGHLSSSSEDGVTGTRLWSTLFHQSGSNSHSKDDEDTHTTERSSTRSQGTAELIGQFLATVSSNSSSRPISSSSDSQPGAGFQSLLDGSTSEDDGADGGDLALFDEESSTSSCSDIYSSDDCESPHSMQDEDDEFLGVAFSTVLAQLEGPCGAFLASRNDGDADSETSELLADMPTSGHQRRGRSRSPRPYTPFGLEMEQSEEEGADLGGQSTLEATPDNGPAMHVLESMFSCFASPTGNFSQNM
jgi:hypothetical protein